MFLGYNIEGQCGYWNAGLVFNYEFPVGYLIRNTHPEA